MASSSSSSSSSADFSRPCPKTGLYDVFLSFRGEDTRYGFTAYLYRLLKESGVYTFMDIKLTGEDIDYLFEMVAKSRMAVVIYSQTFASSDWCLNELEMILQRRKEKKMLMIPIFYKVDVRELKHLSGKTAKYLNKHIQTHGETTVMKWKDAITNLGKVSGLSYQNIHGRYEYDFIIDVIDTIKEKLGETEESQESDIIKEESNDFGTQDNKMIVQDSVIYRIVTSNYFQKQQKELDQKYWDPVKSIDLHPTQPWVLLCWYRGSVTIWDYEIRAEARSFKVSSITQSAKFVPWTHWFMIGDMSGFVRVFNYNSKEMVKVFRAHGGNINCIAAHPTLPLVLTASDDNLIKLWNRQNDWACDETFAGHTTRVLHVAFNPKDSSSFASVSRDGTIKIWSIHSSSEKFTFVEHATISLYWVEYFVGNDDKLYLLSGSYDKLGQVWDYESRTLVKTLKGHTSIITATLIHPKLPIIITTSTDKTVRIWNKNTCRLELVWYCDIGQIWSIGFIESTNEIVLGCTKGMVVMKIVTESGIIKQDSNDFDNQDNKMKAQIVQDSTSHQNIEVSPISQLQQEHRDSSPDTTAGAAGYRIVTTNYSQKQLKNLYRGLGRVASIDLHPTKPWVLLCWDIGTVTIWNHETRAVEKSFKIHTYNTQCAKFDPRVNRIVTGEMIGLVCLFDCNTSNHVNGFQASWKCINCVVLHPTFPLIFTASDDNLIKGWVCRNNNWVCNQTFVGHTQPVYQIAFNPKDQNSFASASMDGTIKIWSLYTSSEKFTFVKHAAILYSVEYFVGNDDKLYLLSGSDDKLVQVWDYESRTLVKTLEGHTSRILATLVHPKLPIIITASFEEDSVRIWNKNTYQLELVPKFDFGSLYSIGLIESTNEIVLGCSKGMVLMKIVTDE